MLTFLESNPEREMWSPSSRRKKCTDVVLGGGVKLDAPEIYKHRALRRSTCCVASQVMFSFSVRTFVTEFKLKKMFLNTTMEKHSDLHEVENEITKTVSFLKGIFLLVLCFLEQILFRIRILLGTSYNSWDVQFLLYMEGKLYGQIRGPLEVEGKCWK